MKWIWKINRLTELRELRAWNELKKRKMHKINEKNLKQIIHQKLTSSAPNLKQTKIEYILSPTFTLYEINCVHIKKKWLNQDFLGKYELMKNNLHWRTLLPRLNRFT